MARLYFLGIGGTLMGSLAQLARAAGHEVSGSDKALYPPMSDQLAAAGITVHTGFDPAQLAPRPDLIVVGNAGLPRGHPGVEYVLESGIPYTSGAAWLGETILRDRWVIAISGTHGKTTTTSMVAWILACAGLDPGYLIGGVPANFSHSAALGGTPFFVVEADEYDTSYFDRRSKFLHYRPRTLVVNNLEYDHADIFPDLDAIQTQFHLLLRTVPGSGLVIAPTNDDNVDEVLRRGCWSPILRFGDGRLKHPHERDNGDLLKATGVSADGRRFTVSLNDQPLGEVRWRMLGLHNVDNALAAIAAARHVGVAPEVSIAALAEFQGVKRRMELIHDDGHTLVYDDFAHHPTAIRSTLQGLRKAVGSDEIIAVIEPRTHTMSLGTLRQDLVTCCAPADSAIWFRGENIKWDLADLVDECVVPSKMYDDLDALVEHLAQRSKHRRHVVIMSNGAFGGIYRKLVDRLQRG
ncbi:MAG: UDP-N-acetylmuramate:L-alanyl-gamma-D-glutamyl-meso-diaminopimelate ligase [Pseudomonadales bacterium]|nr:UDP-N-acetylmuramate:L-alanyl-gamma-D-glutamyl-meso-diaminopimelate ligase [Pseudomonadales bacterium]